MPVLDGLALCNILKSDDNFKLIYFIILTARSSLKDRIMGLDVGADDFLVKPVENQELLARIRSGIRIFNLQSELKNIEHSKAVVDLACTIGHKINNPLSSLILSLKNIENELSVLDKTKYNEDFVIS
jgi:DNA-binding response OmpR family regulator